MTDTQT